MLGAGASCGYGYPIGWDFREQLLSVGAHVERGAEILGVGVERLKAFVHEFRHAQTYSIDQFLGRRSDEFGDVGKGAIALTLLTCENDNALFYGKPKEHWYQYLVNLLSIEPWDRFDPSWLSVVTFNYDRSLEHYLCVSLRSIYGKTEQEVVERLSGLKIVHVYGYLGPPWSADGGIPYGPEKRDPVEAVRKAAACLRVIPEGRDDDATVSSARSLLQQAERICILGFGFDSVNIGRLGAPATFVVESGRAKHLVATCVGMTNAEVFRAVRQVFEGSNVRAVDIREKFHDWGCLTTLRETLILD